MLEGGPITAIRGMLAKDTYRGRHLYATFSPLSTVSYKLKTMHSIALKLPSVPPFPPPLESIIPVSLASLHPGNMLFKTSMRLEGCNWLEWHCKLLLPLSLSI